ncbi:MAG TPA: hypothetical protein VKY65_17580 [Alphaproteobacteria bacterium]|nr:hypothetical protein [Alphaproteobacteria bacterium]
MSPPSETTLFLDPLSAGSLYGGMFGFSLAKLVVLVGIFLIVWYGLKFAARLQELREAEIRRRAEDKRGARRSEHGRGEAAVEEMVKCRVCGAYVPARGAAACGQPGCPFQR